MAKAPDLTIDMEPKFLAINDAVAPRPAGDAVHSSISVPTARTFIHFSEGMARPRLDSDPADSLSEALLMSAL